MSGDGPDDPTKKLPDELLAKARQPAVPKEPLAPPVWDEPDDEVPTEVLSPLPIAAASPAAKPRPQATELDLAYRPLVVHPQPPAEGDAPYADTAISARVSPASAFEPDEQEDPTIVIPVLTPATAKSVVPAGVPVKPSGRKRGR